MGSFSRSFASFSLAIAPALFLYLILPGTSLAGLLLLLSIVLVLVGTKVVSNKKGIVLLAGVLFLSLVTYVANTGSVWFSDSVFIHNIWSILISLLPLVFLPRVLKINVFIKTVIVIGALASVFVLFQRVQLVLTGNFLSFYLPLPMADDVSDTLLRPHAFFKEPAHLAIYLLPSFYLSLLLNKRFLSALFAIGILSCESLTGFLMLFLVFAYWFYVDSKSKKNNFIYIALLSIVAFIVINYLPNLIHNQTERMTSGESLSSMRLLGTVELLKQFDMSYFVWGIGLNQLSSFGGSAGLSNYSNAIVFSFISYGFLGLLLFVLYLFNLFKSYPVNRGFFFIFLGILFSDQLLFNINFTYLISFVFLSTSINQYVNKKK